MYGKLVTPEVFPQKECLADHTALKTENFQRLKEAQLWLPIIARDKSASMDGSDKRVNFRFCAV
jgi:hypothetical protein